MTAKQQWKKYHRLLRVCRREAEKAAIDVMLFGQGAVLVPANGADPQHIPLREIRVGGK